MEGDYKYAVIEAKHSILLLASFVIYYIVFDNFLRGWFMANPGTMYVTMLLSLFLLVFRVIISPIFYIIVDHDD